MVADHPPAGFLKASVDCPDDEDLINALIDAAAGAGAGGQGHYSRVAMVLRGYGTWRSDLGAVERRVMEPPSAMQWSQSAPPDGATRCPVS
ncbi:MAG: hypothetical protein ACR2GX_00315 [Candidatus Dormibacteria bacterium]